MAVMETMRRGLSRTVTYRDTVRTTLAKWQHTLLDGRSMDGPHPGWLLERLTVPEAGPKTSIHDLVRIAIGSGATRLFENERDARGSDAEAVHQARVATRRLRSDLKTLEPLLLARTVEGLRDELAWAGELLGLVRDLDVLIARIEEFAGDLALEPSAVAEITEPLQAERRMRREQLVEGLGSARYLRLCRDLLDANAVPPLAEGVDGSRAARSALRKLVRKTWRRVARATARLDPDPTDESLHEVRKRAKRARYASELAAGILDGRAERLADRLADLQDVLGELQDAVVADERLRAIASRDQLTTEGAFAAGQLVCRMGETREDARARWRGAWDAARSKRLRRWLR